MRIHVVDYGVGNLHSIVRAVEATGGEAVLTGRPEDIAAADRVIQAGFGRIGARPRALGRSGAGGGQAQGQGARRH